jgi:hypothetical protein
MLGKISGPVTEKIREKYVEILHGKDPAYAGFLTPLI